RALGGVVVTWHRDDGAPVAPLPLDRRLALVRAARAITVGGMAGLVLLLGAVVVVGLINEEALGDARQTALLARALAGAFLVLALVVAVGEPLRLAGERALLLRAAEQHA